MPARTAATATVSACPGDAGFHRFGTDNLPGWLHSLTDGLYISTMPGKRRAVTYTLAQTMQTPDDLTATELVTTEAPYMGLLQGTVKLHAFDHRAADRLSLTLGIVGPASGAERAQSFVHKIVGSDDPKGWHHQLDNELVFQIGAERLLRLAAVDVGDHGFDVLGIGRVELGTLKSRVLGGIGLRYGQALAGSFQTATAIPGREINLLAGAAPHSWQLYLNLLGSYVLNDIAIDGNTFRTSHSVPLEHWQAMAVVGFGYSFGRLAVQIETVAATARYDGEPEPTRFGSMSLTYRY